MHMGCIAKSLLTELLFLEEGMLGPQGSPTKGQRRYGHNSGVNPAKHMLLGLEESKRWVPSLRKQPYNVTYLVPEEHPRD